MAQDTRLEQIKRQMEYERNRHQRAKRTYEQQLSAENDRYERNMQMYRKQKEDYLDSKRMAENEENSPTFKRLDKIDSILDEILS